MIEKNTLKIGMIFLISILLISIVSAEATYCCEKTKVQGDGNGGFWCQNAPQEQCDPDFKKAPTSCESTSYCRLGCCYNSNEGTCSSRTPRKICNDIEGGVWEDEKDCKIPQCNLGCCLIGDEAAFVTQTRCKRLSSIYNLETNFRTDFDNEFECIQSATSEVEGACVFEQEFQITCKRTTQRECNRMRTSQGNTSEVEFYGGLLCSSERLGTNCGPTEDKTTCVEDEDQVYFLDTCGNIANIYDSSKAGDNYDSNYWSEIKTPEESCNIDTDGARHCGNCDYFSGSTCKEYDRLKDTDPAIGNYVCRSLHCEYDNDGDGTEERYEHGETFCAKVPGVTEIMYDDLINNNIEFLPLEENLPGTRYFRMLCYNGEIIVEPCADYRQEVCIEDHVDVPTNAVPSGIFRTAACRVNRWEDCAAQDDEDDCENIDQRDCVWLDTDDFTYLNNNNLRLVDDADGVCLPKFAPGLDYWQEGDAEDICSVGDRQCVVKYSRGRENTFIGVGKRESDWDIEKTAQCDPDSGQKYDNWLEEAMIFCSSLGDCGSTVSYIDVEGYYDAAEDLTEITERLDKEELEEELA